VKTAVAATSLVLVLAAGASAGEIVLKNGSRLPGELASESIMVSTGAGALEIAGADVQVLTPTEVRLKDGRVIQGTVVGETVKARTPLGELAIRLDELTSFRADPDTSTTAAKPAPPTVAAPGAPAPVAKAAPPTGVPGPVASTTPAPSAPQPGTAPPASSLAPVGGLPAASGPGPGGPSAPAGVGAAPPVPQTASPTVGGDATAGAPPQENGLSGPSQVASGGRTIGEGVETTAKGIGHTVVQGADAVHDGFKTFGLKVRDVFLGIGQVFRNAFGS